MNEEELTEELAELSIDVMKETQKTLKQSGRIAALQAAAVVHGKGANAYYADVLATAERFLAWIKK